VEPQWLATLLSAVVEIYGKGGRANAQVTLFWIDPADPEADGTGHHCCQTLMARFGITGTVRASFALYNTRSDVEAHAEITRKAVSMLR
jgi:hypothetical protein